MGKQITRLLPTAVFYTVFFSYNGLCNLLWQFSLAVVVTVGSVSSEASAPLNRRLPRLQTQITTRLNPGDEVRSFTVSLRMTT